MALSEILTDEILDSYANACYKMGLDLWTLAEDGNFGHLLMPSRGAFPILWHAKTSFSHELNKYHKNNLTNYLRDKRALQSLNKIWLPFSAYTPDEGISSALQRKHWCLVLKGILTGVDTPELQMHRLFTRDICKQRFDHTATNLHIPAGLVIIDTVISGRAVSEISYALDDAGIRNYVFLLAIDEDGNKLIDPFKTRIQELENQNKAKLYYMKNIFTEDSHPGLTGVTAVTFPQITSLLKNNNSIDATAGFWHLEIKKREDGLNLPFTVTAAITQQLIYKRTIALLDGIDFYGKFENESFEKETLYEQEKSGSENKSLTRDFILPVVKRGGIANAVKDIDVSGSYIVCVYLKDRTADEIAIKFAHIKNNI